MPKPRLLKRPGTPKPSTLAQTHHFPHTRHSRIKSHPVPNPGPSGLRLRGTPGVVVLRPSQDYVAQDRKAPPSRLHVGKCSFSRALWSRSFPNRPREWERIGNPVLSNSPLKKSLCLNIGESQSQSGIGWERVGSLIFQMGKMRLTDGQGLVGDYNSSL